MDALTEILIKKYGEEHRHLITDAIKWLDKQESKWQLDFPINREQYIGDIMSHIYKEEK